MIYTNFGSVQMSQNSKDSTISVRQARAIPIILQARSIEAGCTQARISKTLFYQWLKGPDFAEEYKRLRDVLVDEAMESIKASLNKAVSTLTGLLDTENESLRRSVSNDILNHFSKFREMEDIESRLARLEQTLEVR
jgi:hypothetical protein